MRELRSATITDINGESTEFYYYSTRTVAQHLAIEEMTEKRGGSQTALLLSVFIVCALNEAGERLFSSVDYTQLSTRLEHSELVAACLKMGGVEDADPKG